MKSLIPLLGVLLIGAGGGRPLVIDAVKNADKEGLRALVQRKADVNAAEADGTTALHWAVYLDDLESADLLIRAGAKVSAATDLGVTPLWTASLYGSVAQGGGVVKSNYPNGPDASLAYLELSRKW